ncbi:MAG: hypothetical protein D4S02_15455 [Rhodocyclaceae bacterium]|nr:MAG: hypothetical protein D4S02_15455 [Rhodocyclaceae bacterium]
MKPLRSHVAQHALLLSLVATSVASRADGFVSDSKRLGNSRMDIVMTESARGARTSVIDITIKSVGSSVGSSFFIACSLRTLARQRGGFRHIVKLEEQPGRNQMLVGFLDTADEAPERIDPRFAGQRAIDVEQFAPICEQMK